MCIRDSPSGLLVDNGSLTVLQAIALAGGTNRTAKMNGVRIVRKGPAGMTETRVPLKKMLEAKVPDVTLQADDILFVPVSGGRVLAGRSFEAAMSAATAVGIYTAVYYTHLDVYKRQIQCWETASFTICSRRRAASAPRRGET